MVGLKFRDINKDTLMMFALSYEYSLSFTNLLKLFNISKQYFWTFMEICTPMLKMGVRKASMLRKSVEKIYAILIGGEPQELTIKEEKILDYFMWFVEDSFSDGEGCLSLDQLSAIPFVRGFSKDNVCISYDYNSLKNNIDRVDYVKVGEDKFHKTSKALFLMEKYCGDLDFYQINNLSVRDIQKRIDETDEKHQQEELELALNGKF